MNKKGFMDNKRVIEIISLLAEGIDPYTGEIFSDESLFQNPETVRALYKVLEGFRYFNCIETAQGNKKSMPENSGKKWTKDEEVLLVELFESEKPLVDIAKDLKRTRGSIRSRLIRLGKVKEY